MKPLRKLRVAPATKDYLREEEERDPSVRKVFDGLTWRLIHEQSPPGYPLPDSHPPRYLIKKVYRLPVPRLLRLVYQMTDKEVFIELAQVVDFKEQENS